MNKPDYYAIREMYKSINTDLYNPYPMDWLSIFTPIELMAWSDIRDYNMKMWPQYPIDRYFADFANIEHKVIIECDGKDWHDRNKDYARDKKLIELGWVVYRITGKECVRVVDDFEHGDDWIDRYDVYLSKLYSSSTGIIKAIYHFHYEEIIRNEQELLIAECALKSHRSKI